MKSIIFDASYPSPQSSNDSQSFMHIACYMLMIALAIFVYLYGLDGQNIPKNGDEFVYAHITKLTAESGHLLPLNSELHHMRNTKPPLLFWQGIYSTAHGTSWTLWRLRFPSVFYTLLSSFLVGLLTFRLSHKLKLGFQASIIFLAFFSTYRYGRPFLVNPAETLWLFLPFFTLLYWSEKSFTSQSLPWLLGIEIGIGLLFKSFILIVPIISGLLWWYLHQRHYNWKLFLQHDIIKLFVMGGLALTLFSLWFVFDPNPQAIWNEFVIGENAGKLQDQEGSYFKTLIWGDSSIWTMILGYPFNAGLLAFPVLGLMINAARFRSRISDSEKMLWFWCITLLLFFCIPSQRSTRYLLDAMPALAILCSLGWHRIHHHYFIPSFLAILALIILLCAMEFCLQQSAISSNNFYAYFFWFLVVVTSALALTGLFLSRLTRSIINIVILLTYLVVTTFLQPLDTAAGVYSAITIKKTQKVDIGVPCNFRAGYEAYRFWLPGAIIHSYRDNLELSARELAHRYPMFIIHVPIQQTTLDCEECTIIDQRIDVQGRHSPQQIKRILHGKIYENLFFKEWLIASSGIKTTRYIEEGCR